MDLIIVFLIINDWLISEGGTIKLPMIKTNNSEVREEQEAKGCQKMAINLIVYRLQFNLFLFRGCSKLNC